MTTYRVVFSEQRLPCSGNGQPFSPQDMSRQQRQAAEVYCISG
ncbi:hypothetical protein [Paenibacillus durus]|nr:hypothetical protein [Paenibacillus durus]